MRLKFHRSRHFIRYRDLWFRDAHNEDLNEQMTREVISKGLRNVRSSTWSPLKWDIIATAIRGESSQNFTVDPSQINKCWTGKIEIKQKNDQSTEFLSVQFRSEIGKPFLLRICRFFMNWESSHALSTHLSKWWS